MRKCITVLLMWVAALPVTAGVIHRSLFNGNLSAEAGGRWEGNNFNFVQGVEGKAVHLKGAEYITFPNDVGFSSEEGSLSLWVKTDWDGNDSKIHVLAALGKKSGLRIIKDAENRLQFIWDPGGGRQSFRLHFSIANEWPAQIWRHLTFTWKKGVYLAYVDGMVRTGGTPDDSVFPLTETTRIFLGGTTDALADLAIDELVLRNNEMSRAEVAQSHVSGMESLELRSDPRLVMHALINETPAALILDTGSMLHVLFKPFAIKAGLKLMPSYRGGVMFDEESNAMLTFGQGGSFKQHFAILQNTAGFEQQGFIGWPQFFAVNKVHVLWEHRTMVPLTEETMKSITHGWSCYDILPDASQLILRSCPIRIGDIELNLPLLIDTGDGTGLNLTKKTWEAILPKINQSRRGLSAAWTPKKGTQRFISMVPDEITLLGTRMHNISVCQNNHQRDVDTAPEQAIIGLAALSYFDVVIDGVAGKLWLKPRSSPAIHEDINLSGLLFEHDSTIDSKKHTTFVLANSPAWNLGLRTGDEIIEVDGIPPDPNEMDPDYQIDVKRRLSHGDAIRLKVRRGEKMFDVIQTNAKN